MGFVIDVAVDGAEGSYGCQTFCNVEGADVARVPNFIARLEVFRIAVVPVAVGI